MKKVVTLVFVLAVNAVVSFVYIPMREDVPPHPRGTIVFFTILMIPLLYVILSKIGDVLNFRLRK